MCSSCDNKEYELIHLHKEVARLITNNHYLIQRIDALEADNNALRVATADLHRAVVRAGQQHISRKTGAM